MRSFLAPLAALAALAAVSSAAAQAPASAHVAHAARGAPQSALGEPAPSMRARVLALASLTAPVVTVTARDYAFESPDSVPAGITTIRLVNRGPELHHVQLIRLDDGKTAADLMAALKAGGPPPSWSRDVGGPNTPAPGAESRATVELSPGRHVVLCFIPSPDGTPHVAKGMLRELVVTPAKGRPGRVEKPHATMSLFDYNFTLSAPLTAGERTIRVRNDAKQAHEVFIVRLAPGKTVGDVLAWLDKREGPPPGEPLGGTTGIAPGGWNDVSLTLTPGEYGLLCFVPDAKDGKPHFEHGMLKQLTVAQ